MRCMRACGRACEAAHAGASHSASVDSNPARTRHARGARMSKSTQSASWQPLRACAIVRQTVRVGLEEAPIRAVAPVRRRGSGSGSGSGGVLRAICCASSCHEGAAVQGLARRDARQRAAGVAQRRAAVGARAMLAWGQACVREPARMAMRASTQAGPRACGEDAEVLRRCGRALHEQLEDEAPRWRAARARARVSVRDVRAVPHTLHTLNAHRARRPR
jgi:hypothetical protein